MPKLNLLLKIVIVLVFSIVLILFDSIDGFSSAYSLSSRVSKPINTAISDVYYISKGPFEIVPKIKIMSLKNQDLKEEMQKIETENLELKRELEVEKFKVNQSIFAPDLRERKIIEARVLQVERVLPNIYIEIDRGSRDNLKVGQNVIYENRFIGVVDSVYKATAKIKLFGSSGIKVPIVLLNSGFKGVAEYSSEDGYIITNILQIEKPIENEFIISSGQGGVYEEGFILGKVGKLISDESESLYSYEIEDIQNYDNLKFVALIVD
jgi:rod shape-determining protein MreC